MTGGSGLIGRRLTARLLARGDQPVVLTRSVAGSRGKLDPRVQLVEGDPTQNGAWESALREADGVIHLAGEGVFAQRWSPAFKDRIRASRSLGTLHVARALAAGGRRVPLVSASAVGFYGPRGDEPIDESATNGSDFLASVCLDWEKACDPARDAGARVVNARIGVVLDPSGGALAQMLPPFKLFVGGPAGSGRQWLPWVSAEDTVGLLLFALDRKEAVGPLNVCAPEPVTMHDFAKALGRVLARPSWAPVPAFALRAMLGEVAEVVLNGARVLPKKALDLGYVFQHSSIEVGLRASLAASAR